MSEYMPFLNQDTFTETSLNFSPSFLERNRDYVPVNPKRVEEDILLENVRSPHQNDRLPKLMKQVDSKFDRVEELLKKARFMLRETDRSGAKATVESSFEPDD